MPVISLTDSWGKMSPHLKRAWHTGSPRSVPATPSPGPGPSPRDSAQLSGPAWVRFLQATLCEPFPSGASPGPAVAAGLQQRASLSASTVTLKKKEDSFLDCCLRQTRIKLT